MGQSSRHRLRGSHQQSDRSLKLPINAAVSPDVLGGSRGDFGTGGCRLPILFEANVPTTGIGSRESGLLQERQNAGL
jgi:hypothetical protein